ncbi:hypothetical protein NLU13_6733 [Sarocladium strictum]|uniref:Rhodanese domain-containing protein n=1 Tax=Sarocladium strictum TaxID=5046 RepID=A0AA39GFE6_SARSR|nr:hypothetical protein NLU13_6733 [Sarocladium strictum]
MSKSITAARLRDYWLTRQEIALLDVREEGPFSVSHPLWAVSVPVSEIEDKLPALVSRVSCPVVVYDDGEGYVDRAVARISALGYLDVAILEGGLSAYSRVGEVYRDVNVPPKAFGELVEAIRKTPSISANEAQQLLESNDDVVVLDVRRYEEYHTMSIPRGQSCPGAELLFRVFEVAPSPDTTIIVHCAGRTRGLLGTQSLLNTGIPNKVMALRNGTIGWTLGGLTLDHGKVQRAPPPSPGATAKSRRYAQAWAQHVGVVSITGTEISAILEKTDTRSIYLLDVRDPEEYAQGHLPGFISAPGGQLVQATDEWVGVRGGLIVLYDTDGIRARMTASWLVQLGWEVYVLEDQTNLPATPPKLGGPVWQAPQEGSISVEELLRMSDVTIIDLARSPVYSKGHIPEAWHASGPELARDLNTVGGSGPIVLTSPNGDIAAMNIHYAKQSVPREVFYLAGGTEAWKTVTGKSLDVEPRWISEPIDVYKRPYEGRNNSREAMQAYIDWEHGLVAQLANDGVAGFHVVRDMPIPAEP